MWLEYDYNYQGAYCKVCRKQEPQSLQKTGGARITKPFKNWKRQWRKCGHILKVILILNTEAELLAARARKEESSIIQQLQIIGEQERVLNRSSITTLLLCTIFLHGSTFFTLLDLVVSCGGDDLKQFADRAGRNSTYISYISRCCILFH